MAVKKYKKVIIRTMGGNRRACQLATGKHRGRFVPLSKCGLKKGKTRFTSSGSRSKNVFRGKKNTCWQETRKGTRRVKNSVCEREGI
jgi:hypothetical protein